MGISKSAFNAGMAAARAIKGKSGRTWSCCGLPVEVDHKKQGCTGQAENNGQVINQPTVHSGEIFMTNDQYKTHVANKGKVKSARRGDGGYYVITK